MFDLKPGQLPDSVLDCGAGPSSFCARAREKSTRVVAVDPIYELSPDEIESRIQEAIPRILAVMRENSEQFLFDQFDSPVEVVEGRHESMEVFLEDFRREGEEPCYRTGSIRDLEFGAGEFDLAVSSHFLFLYDDKLSSEFHITAAQEVLRVASEFRIFPLKNLRGEPSTHLQPVAETLSEEGHELEVHEVPYEFQRGADQMLVVQ